MSDGFYCAGCGKRRPLPGKVERAGKRPKCRERRAPKLAAAAGQATDRLRRPAAKLNTTFLRWVSHV